MIDKKNLSLLNTAKSFELGRFNLYKNLAEKVINPGGKNALILLRNAEKMHWGILKKEISKLKSINKLELKSLIKSKPAASKKLRRFEDTIKRITSDLSIMRKAVALEKGDPPYYAHLIKKTKRKDAKKLFSILKKEEEKHLRLIRIKLKMLQEISYDIIRSQNPRNF